MFKSAKIKNILSYFVSVLMLLVLVVPLFVQAQDTTVKAPDPVKIVINNPFKVNTIEGLIKTIVNDILLPVGGVVAVIMIMYAGFLYVTARGNDTKITEARKALTWAVVGAAILLGAWAISQAISTTVDQLRA